MSPIIYTPHDCDRPHVATVGQAVLWQCETCGKVWGSDSAGWSLAVDPGKDAALRSAYARFTQPEAPAAPMVTDRMVQLVLDTYTDHMAVVPNVVGAEPLGTCAECETGIYGQHTIQAHAREKAIAALQEALAAGDVR
ncbi:hypothetical protein [Kocuria rhizophila]|uniref:hypothetical protein n=1 Tax=Kocuria rhizophila TaxID=72000 RepID=UPI003D6EA802